MKVEFTHKFIKIYKKRFTHRLSVGRSFEERVRLFEQNPTHPILENHFLSGTLKGCRAFSITGDIRVIYYVKDETAYFINIGTHNQVYS